MLSAATPGEICAPCARCLPASVGEQTMKELRLSEPTFCHYFLGSAQPMPRHLNTTGSCGRLGSRAAVCGPGLGGAGRLGGCGTLLRTGPVRPWQWQ